MKRRIEKRYEELITCLQEAQQEINDLKANSRDKTFTQLQQKVSDVLYTEIKNIEKEVENSMKHISWDNLVIAFFGETNAGKSTIIETFRILYETDRPKGTDGLIVGDGRQDFTKDANEYTMSIGGKKFTLIDVPGIEGNEQEFKEIIIDALHKAHCVFYVHGHTTKPNAATTAKIKEYLGDWVNVYSIYNIKGSVSSYEKKEKREVLLPEKKLKKEKLVKDTFQNILGDIYKGNVSLQALLAMCANASFSSEHIHFLGYQEKLLEYFGSPNEMLRFSQFQTLSYLVEQKSVDFIDEIVEANKQKMLSLAKRTSNIVNRTLNNGDTQLSNVRDILKDFRRDVSSTLNETRNNTKSLTRGLVRQEMGLLKTKLFNVVESATDNREQEANNIISTFKRDLPLKIKTRIQTQIGMAQKKIEQKAKDVDFINVRLTFNQQFYIDSNIQIYDALEELDISFDDVLDFGVTVAGMAGTGAAIGSFVPIVGTIAGAIGGAVVGTIVHGAKSAMGDGGKGEAKKEISNKIREFQDKILRQITPYLNSVDSQINKELKKATSLINDEIERIEEFDKITDSIKRKMEIYSNNIKQSAYGKI